MRNQFTEFKTLLKILPLQVQIIEIDEKINEVRNEKIRIVRLTYHSLSVIKEHKHMKQNKTLLITKILSRSNN